MTQTNTNPPIPITQKETEALVWMIAEIADRPTRAPTHDRDPLGVLLLMAHPRQIIMRRAKRLEKACYARLLPAGLQQVDRDILQVCVECSTWIEIYRTGDHTKHSPSMINEALATLRGLATKFEPLGIEINHIPFD